jgi:hypothetical protein
MTGATTLDGAEGTDSAGPGRPGTGGTA